MKNEQFCVLRTPTWEADLEGSASLQLKNSGSPQGSRVTTNIIQTKAVWFERQSSKIEEERTTTRSLNSSLDERTDVDLPLQQSPLRQSDSKAIGSIVSIKTRRSIRKLKERNRSENDEEQATASSSNFGTVEHAFRESPNAECQIDSNDIGCSVISNTRRSICNLTERN